MREFRLKRLGDDEPKPVGILSEDGFTEHDDLEEALAQPGVLMRRFSAGRVEHGDGSVVWFARYYESGRPHPAPDHAIWANSSPEAQRFYDDH
jgi:hypothetical protein